MSEAIADRLAPAAAGDDVGESDSAYVLKARAEIVHVLRDLIRTRAFNTVHMGGAQGTLVTTLLAKDTARSSTNLLSKVRPTAASPVTGRCWISKFCLPMKVRPRTASWPKTKSLFLLKPWANSLLRVRF